MCQEEHWLHVQQTKTSVNSNYQNIKQTYMEVQCGETTQAFTLYFQHILSSLFDAHLCDCVPTFFFLLFLQAIEWSGKQEFKGFGLPFFFLSTKTVSVESKFRTFGNFPLVSSTTCMTSSYQETTQVQAHNLGKIFAIVSQCQYIS